MNIPHCLVIIPDGNRRWAKGLHKTPMQGHQRGLVNGRRIAQRAFELGVKHVVFLCATEANLTRRPLKERYFLYELLERENLHNHSIKRRQRLTQIIAFVSPTHRTARQLDVNVHQFHSVCRQSNSGMFFAKPCFTAATTSPGTPVVLHEYGAWSYAMTRVSTEVSC